MSDPPPAPGAVLVVDDNRELAENVGELFAGQGHLVRIATSVEEAHAKFAPAHCDLAIVDIRLSGQSGVELAGAVKHHCPEAEVILMTGNASLDTAIEAIHGDAFAYLEKPFDPEALLALGERALRQVQLRRERARLQHELAHSEALYRGVVNAVDSFIVGLDRDGTVEMWSRFAAESTGWDPKRMLGSKLQALLSSDRARAELREALERAFGGEEVSDLELTLATAHDSPRIVRWTLSRLIEDVTSRDLVLAVGIDLTDRIELERRAAEAETMASLGNLTAGLAHEIRNPLNAAVLQLELLQRSTDKLDDGALRERMTSRVAIVREEIERLSHLLNDFLNLARPRAIELTSVDLRALLSEVLALHEPVVKAAGLRLRLELDEGPLLTRGNAGMLKQVLGNLILNACEAMRERGHGEIELGCHATSEKRIELSVRDDGPGIPEHVASRLFTPFVTSKQAGTGLGLTIVKRIVDRHGGTIHVASTPERGTSVRISLERAR